MSLSASFTFGRWCRTFLSWLSFVSLALALGDGPKYNYTVNCDDVSVTRGSGSHTTVLIHVWSTKPNTSVAMTIGFRVHGEKIQCKTDNHLCYGPNVSLTLNSNKTTSFSITAPSVSRDDVIQDTVVILEPILRKDTVVTLVQVSDGTTTKPSVTHEQIQWDNITVTLKDDRRLRVGFTRRDTVHFDKNGMAKLYVMNFDTPLRLNKPLLMSIIMRRSDDKSYVSQTVANISFPEHNISAPILIVDQERDYSQQYEATIETQNNNVQLDPSTVQIAYNPNVELVELKEDMEILKANMTSVQTELRELMKKLTEAASTTEEINMTTKSGLTTETTTTTTTTATTATTEPKSDPTETTVDAASTAATTDPLTATEKSTTAIHSEPKSAGSTGTTGSVNKSNLSTTEEDVESAENTDSNDTFMWWILAGFVVLMVVTVSGYLLYNHRAKVMVYVGSVWKGNSDKLPTTGQPNRRKNKYTPLPTSIHDTLTHED